MKFENKNNNLFYLNISYFINCSHIYYSVFKWQIDKMMINTRTAKVPI